MYSIRILL